MESKRQLQVAELIKRHFAPVFQEHGIYIYGSTPFVSVSSVKLTPDLSQAKIYVSIYNAANKDEVLEKISNHTHMLKQALAQRLRHHIRRMPQIFFYSDETIDEMYQVDALFKKIKNMYPESTHEEE
jgi:ribosome-binding factor A